MKGKRRTYPTAVIDGQQVKIRKGQTILEGAGAAGIYIPTLCHLEKLEPYGGCRLCVVEVKGMKGYPTACTTPMADGMEVATITPGLQKLRREILEFTLSEHPYTCLVCRDKKECGEFMHSTRKVSTITGCNFCTSNGDCELQDLVDYLDLNDMRFPITYRGLPPVQDNPFYDLDYNLCVLCGRCVRICNEERNSHVLAFVERGSTTIVGTAFGESQADAGCEFCGACVDVCPTGSISEKMGKWRGIPDRSLKTTCVICPVACDMNVNTRNGQIVQVGPPPGKRTGPPQLCLRGKFLPSNINGHPDRIKAPLIRRDNKWVEVSWKEAFDFTAQRLGNYKGGSFGMIASGQDTLEDNYILQKFTRNVMHSNNVDMHGSYPEKGIPGQLYRFRQLNSQAGLDATEKADTLLLLGTDASVSHPLLENRIRKAYRDGKNVISFGSHTTRTSTFVTAEVQYQPGEENSLLFLLFSVLDKNLSRKEDLSMAEECAGIEVADLEKALASISDSEYLVIIAGDDLLRQPSSGVILRRLFALHGIIGKAASCDIVFPGYEGNLFSGALTGTHPSYLPGFHPVPDDQQGLSCNEMIRSAGKGGIGALMMVGDLPAHPGLGELDFMVQCNMFMTDATQYADVLLPVADFFEIEGHVLSLDGKLKKVNKTVAGPENVKSIAGIIAGLAGAMGQSGYPRKPSEIFRELRPLIENPVPVKSSDIEAGLKDLSLKIETKSNGFPVGMMVHYNQFRYRGNMLSDLVEDLRPVTGEGALGLSDSLMIKLKVKEGDRVRIISEHGEMDSVVRSNPGMNCQNACLFADSIEPSGIQGGVYPERHVMNVKIEKV